MVQLFAGISFVFADILIICALFIKKAESNLSGRIRNLFMVAAVTMLCNGISTIAQVEWLDTLACGLYFAATDWLVYCLVKFVQKYTNLENKEKIVSGYLIAGSILDTASMLVNVFTHHAFRGIPSEYDDGKITYRGFEAGPFYNSHLYFVYSAAIIAILYLIVKIYRTQKNYRAKYYTILLIYCLILCSNIFYRFMKNSFDYSPFFYLMFAIAIAYYSMFYVSKSAMNKILSYVVYDTDEAIICYDNERKCIYSNYQADKWFNENGDKQKYTNYLIKWLGDKKLKDKELKDYIDEKWNEEYDVDGEKRNFRATYRIILGEDNCCVGSYFVIRDITKEIQQIEEERYIASHDVLTGLYNMNGFSDIVRKKLDENKKDQWSIVCLDIKDFKLFNSFFGQNMGDKMLVQIAQLLKDSCGEEAICGRLSGDRFALFVKSNILSREQLREVAKAARKSVENSAFHMHIHFGIYKITNPKLSVLNMCDKARLAISRIKNSYEESIAVYDEELSDERINENRILNDFQDALLTNQFQMYLQPQISVDGNMIGAEALVRWIKPDGEMVMPFKFIPVIERVGLMYRLDKFIWEEACKRLRRWKDKGREDIYISVNVSPTDFYFMDVYMTLTGLIKKYDISPKQLRIEVTEKAVFNNADVNQKTINELRKFGFEIGIDDFGNGYASMNILKDLVADAVIIDMGFLCESEKNERSEVIMNAIIKMCNTLGMKVICEGVETEKQILRLKKAGCDILQGYYFSKPIPIDKFEKKYDLKG